MPTRERFSIARALAQRSDADALRSELQRLDVDLLRASPYRLRDDSKLAFLFCARELAHEWTRDEVLHELMCVQYLCANTAYARATEPALRSMAEQLKRGSARGVSWGAVWQALARGGPDLLKYTCLALRDARFPLFHRRQWGDDDDADWMSVDGEAASVVTAG
jgi:hypothetical protein